MHVRLGSRVTKGHVLVQGFKRGKTGPGSEGEQVFITRAGGGGECAREGAACAKAGNWKALVSG